MPCLAYKSAYLHTLIFRPNFISSRFFRMRSLWVYFLLIILSIFCVDVFGDNPTAIVKPGEGPDPGYIIATCDSGLANRLRVLAAYMHVGKRRFDNAHLLFVWDVNSACPGMSSLVMLQ